MKSTIKWAWTSSSTSRSPMKRYSMSSGSLGSDPRIGGGMVVNGMPSGYGALTRSCTLPGFSAMICCRIAGPSGPAGPAGPSGPSAIRIGFDVPAGTAETELASAGGLVLRGACSAGGDLSLEASSTTNNARARALVVAAATPTDSVAYDEDDDLDTIDGFDFVGAADDDAIATLVYRSSAGGVVTANLILEQYSVGGAARCLVAGSAVVAG